MNEINWNDVLALEPVYTAHGGNGTRLYLEDKTERVLEMRVNTAMRHLCMAYAVDQEELLRRAGVALHRRRQLPLAIAPDRVYVPFPMRRPLAKDDGGQGRIRYDAIQHIWPKEDETVLMLTSGHRVTVLLSAKGVAQRMHHGQVVQSVAPTHWGWNQNHPDTPVTWGDLQAMVRRLFM